MPPWLRPCAGAVPASPAAWGARRAASARSPLAKPTRTGLRRGLAELEASDPARAARVRARAGQYGDGDDEPCPALDPDTGACDLYAWRPLTCRVFGPPVRSGSGAIGMCELCFEGASDEEIAACAVEIDPAVMEQPEETNVARALVPSQ